MRLTLVRNATLLLELAGKRVLVDPMLDGAGARPPIEGTRNPVANPTAPLPMPPEEVVRGLDAVVVTHRHRDHLDGTAEQLLPRDVPVFCQPEDEEALRELGLEARPVDEDVDWEGLRIVRTPGRHGTGPIADALAPVSGFVLDGLYIAGDTVWYEGVEETIERHRPRVAVVNAGIDGDLVRDMMLEAVEYRFAATEAPAPIEWLSDNGSPYIAGDTRAFAKELGLVPLTTPIESPQSNGMAKAFVNTLRRDYVSVNPTPDARTILVSLPHWIEHYNEHHPHSSLKMRSPRMFRREQSLME